MDAFNAAGKDSEGDATLAGRAYREPRLLIAVKWKDESKVIDSCRSLRRRLDAYTRRNCRRSEEYYLSSSITGFLGASSVICRPRGSLEIGPIICNAPMQLNPNRYTI